MLPSSQCVDPGYFLYSQLEQDEQWSMIRERLFCQLGNESSACTDASPLYSQLLQLVAMASEVMTHPRSAGPLVLKLGGASVTIEVFAQEFGGDPTWDKVSVDGVCFNNRFDARDEVVRKMSWLF